jgi:two-component system nitrogen regulation response regulator GlnG
LRLLWLTPAGEKKDAAQLLGWGRNTLTRKLQEYSMENQAL